MELCPGHKSNCSRQGYGEELGLPECPAHAGLWVNLWRERSCTRRLNITLRVIP